MRLHKACEWAEKAIHPSSADISLVPSAPARDIHASRKSIWQFSVRARRQKRKRVLVSPNCHHFMLGNPNGRWGVTSLIKNRKAEYAEYMKSEHWAQLRQAKFRQVGLKCQRCPKTTRLQCHHHRYRYPWTLCTIDDLTVLCKGCHKWEHNRKRNRWPKRQPKAKKKSTRLYGNAARTYEKYAAAFSSRRVLR